MSETTANLELPYILPSQAQKHVTHNEALQRLDAITQLTVTASLATPPSDPQEGTCYDVAASPTGAWTGKAGKLAFVRTATGSSSFRAKAGVAGFSPKTA